MSTSSNPEIALTIFLGRAGDRNPRGMLGAAILGAALEAATGLDGARIGAPATPLGADWASELDAARPGLNVLAASIEGALAAGKAPLTVAGRCAAGLASLPVIARTRPDASIVWFDAHGDCNTPATTTTGYLGGLVLTGAAGLWDSGLGGDLDLGRTILVGSRDLDPPERALIACGGMRLVEPGPNLPARLRTALAGRPAYVHLDCDVLNPRLVPSEYQVEGGLSFSELREAFAVIGQAEVVGFEITEFEASWPDGSAGSPTLLLEALQPILTSFG